MITKKMLKHYIMSAGIWTLLFVFINPVYVIMFFTGAYVVGLYYLLTDTNKHIHMSPCVCIVGAALPLLMISLFITQVVIRFQENYKKSRQD